MQQETVYLDNVDFLGHKHIGAAKIPHLEHLALNGGLREITVELNVRERFTYIQDVNTYPIAKHATDIVIHNLHICRYDLADILGR